MDEIKVTRTLKPASFFEPQWCKVEGSASLHSAPDLNQVLRIFFSKFDSDLFGAAHSSINARGRANYNPTEYVAPKNSEEVFFCAGVLTPDPEKESEEEPFLYSRSSSFKQFGKEGIVYGLLDFSSGIPTELNHFIRPNRIGGLEELTIRECRVAFELFRPTWFGLRIGTSPKVYARFWLEMSSHTIYFAAEELGVELPVTSCLDALSHALSESGVCDSLMSKVGH